MSEDGPFHGRHSRRRVPITGEVNVQLYQLGRRDNSVEAVVEFTNEGTASYDLTNIRGMLFSSTEGGADSGQYETYSEARDISVPARSSRRLSMTCEVGALPVDSLKIEVAGGEVTLPITDLPGM